MVLGNLKSKRELNLTVIFLLVLSAFALFELGFAATPITNSTWMFVYIKNTAPTVNWWNVTSASVLPGATITVRANATDVNGDALTFNFTVYNTTNNNKSGVGMIKLAWDSTEKKWRNNTYTIPAGADTGTWTVNLSVGDGTTTSINSTTFTVSAQISTVLQNTPIDFGNQTTGLTAQNASDGIAVAGKYAGSVKGFPLIINNTGNVNVNYSINGTNLTGEDTGKVIGPGNVTWNITRSTVGTRDGKYALVWDVPVIINTTIGSGAVQRVYFYIDTPSNLSKDRYNGTIFIMTSDE